MSKPTKEESRALRARLSAKPTLRLVPEPAKKAKMSPTLALSIAIETVVLARKAVEEDTRCKPAQLEPYKQRLAKAVLPLAPTSKSEPQYQKISEAISPRLLLIEITRLVELANEAIENDAEFARELADDGLLPYKKRFSFAAQKLMGGE